MQYVVVSIRNDWWSQNSIDSSSSMSSSSSSSSCTKNCQLILKARARWSLLPSKGPRVRPVGLLFAFFIACVSFWWKKCPVQMVASTANRVKNSKWGITQYEVRRLYNSSISISRFCTWSGFISTIEVGLLFFRVVEIRTFVCIMRRISCRFGLYTGS